MKFVSKYKNDFFGALGGAVLGYFIAFITGFNSFVTTLISAAFWMFIFGWMKRRAAVVERWRRRYLEDKHIETDEGTWWPRKPFKNNELDQLGDPPLFQKGAGWSYYPKGYKRGVGSPWYKSPEEKHDDEVDPSS